MAEECRACFEHERFNAPHCEEHCPCVDCEPRRIKRRIAELETQLAERRTPELAVLEEHFKDMVGEAEDELEFEGRMRLFGDIVTAARASAEAKLAEQEGLERKRDALLCTKHVTELHQAASNRLRAYHQVAFRAPGTSELLGDYLGKVGVGPDYWQALRAALDEASESGKGKDVTDTFKLTCLKCGRSMTLEQGPLTRADTTIDECALCNDERADPPQPITFRDDEGRERRLIVSSDLRDATPDDLSRAGYSPLKEAMRWYKRAQVYRREIRRMNAALRVANLVAREQAGRIAELLTPTKIKAMLAELEALRALERYCRGLEWNRPTALEPLLKAIDEAREKKETT